MAQDINTKPLERALRTLTPDQGPIARRNARARVRAALKALTHAVDTLFPAPPRKVVSRKRRTFQEKRRDLIRAGWLVVATNSARGKELLTWVAQNKLPVQSTPFGEINGQNYPAEAWVPGWVAHYYPNATLAQQARKNVKMIQAADAAIRLGSLKEKGYVLCPIR